MTDFWSRTRNRVLVIVGAVALLVVGGLVATYFAFVGKALPGSTVAGIDVSGLTKAQVTALLEDESATPIMVSVGDETVMASPTDAGVVADVDGAVAEVFQPNESFIGTLTGLFSSRDIPVAVEVSATQVEQFSAGLPLPAGSPVEDASVAFVDGAFQVVPGKTGLSIDTDALASSLREAAPALVDVQVKAQTKEEIPAVSDEAAQSAANTANAWLATEVTISDDEYETITADVQQKASWIAFTQEGDQLTPTVDPEKVTEWVQNFADEVSIQPTPGIRNVDQDGQVVATVHGPKSGWVAANVSDVVNVVTAALPAQSGVFETLQYVEQEGEWEERPADPATADLLYRAAAGEKWIDLNLGTATVTAYEGANVVGGPFYMVPGAPETPTVEGEFNVYLKYEVQTMRGLNADGTEYETPDVPWVTYFEGGYGFHGAPWRSSFGWNGPGGSHGCINMPVDQALFIYEWADMGTKVISHY